MYRVQYYPWFQVFTGSLRTYALWIRGGRLYLFSVTVHQILVIQVKFFFPLTHLPICNSNIIEIIYGIIHFIDQQNKMRRMLTVREAKISFQKIRNSINVSAYVLQLNKITTQ